MTLRLFLKTGTIIPHPVTANTATTGLFALAGPGVTVDDVAAINDPFAVNAASTNALVTTNAVVNTIATNTIATNVVAGDTEGNNYS